MEKNKKATKEAINALKAATDCISDYALAKKLNIPAQSLGRYSNAKTSISLDKLEEFANQLGKKIKITFEKK